MVGGGRGQAGIKVITHITSEILPVVHDLSLILGFCLRNFGFYPQHNIYSVIHFHSTQIKNKLSSWNQWELVVIITLVTTESPNKIMFSHPGLMCGSIKCGKHK